MFISDLNILETVEVSAVVGGTSTPTKNIVLNTTVKQAYNIDINLVKKAVVNSALTSYVHTTGTAATTVFENTAIGNNGYVQSDVSNTVIVGTIAESAGVLIAAGNK